MDYEKIKKLMDDMGNSKLTSIEIDLPDGTKISMKKDLNSNVAQNNVSVTNGKIDENEVKENTINESVEQVKKDDDLKIIKSPMVGTFYLKPSPTSEPFAKVGDTIKKGQTVCIIEAMKLMNEIESEYDGEIKEVYVKDGEPVEYGTPLFGIK